VETTSARARSTICAAASDRKKFHDVAGEGRWIVGPARRGRHPDRESSAPRARGNHWNPRGDASSSFTRTPEPLRIGPDEQRVAFERLAHVFDESELSSDRLGVGQGMRSGGIGADDDEAGARARLDGPSEILRAGTSERLLIRQMRKLPRNRSVKGSRAFLDAMPGSNS